MNGLRKAWTSSTVWAVLSLAVALPLVQGIMERFCGIPFGGFEIALITCAGILAYGYKEGQRYRGGK